MAHLIEDVVEQEMSLQEFLDRPDTSPWAEYANGRAIMNPSPELPHALITANLHRLLIPIVPDDHITLMAPLDWLLWSDPNGRVRQPDLLVVPRSILTERRVLVPPVLTVEIISPWSRRTDLVTKPAEYTKAGCPGIWVIDQPGPIVHVFDGSTGEPREVTVVSGNEILQVDAPFPISLRPAELLAR